MAKKIESNEEATESKPNIHILRKNFGGRLGNQFVWIEKGSELDEASESALISALYRAGACIELKA